MQGIVLGIEGTGVIWNAIAFETLVIPAKAGILAEPAILRVRAADQKVE
jgi:hypothetical protein